MPSRKIIKPTKCVSDRQPELARHMENMDREPPFDPAARMALHKASKAALGPDPGGTVRVTMRNKTGDEKPTVRKMYDRTVKVRRKP